MHSLISDLITSGPVLTDGAWGTQLQARGLPFGACPDAWNLERPDRVEEVARLYVEAGSQVILTNTFGANRITLARYGLAHRTVEINRTGAAISCKAAAGRSKVFASIGPTGVILMMGDVPEEEVREAFREQAAALAEGGADALVIETMADLQEARVAVEAARETGLPVVACVVFGSGRDGDRTLMGATPEQAAQALVEAGADVIGSNCGVGPASMRGIAARMKAATNLPLWLKPNAGQPELTSTGAAYRITPEEFTGEAMGLVAEGASFIGGCCGTQPGFIQALAAALAAVPRRTGVE